MGCSFCKHQSKRKKSLNHTSGKLAVEISATDMMPNKVLFDEYVSIKYLGAGSFSEVMLTYHKPSKQQRALKIIKKSTLVNQQLTTLFQLSETALLKQFDHPNIIKCYQEFEDSEHFYLPMEYCKGGNLKKFLKQLSIIPEKKVAEIINQVFLAVSYFHDINVIHRDLKPENILLTFENDFYVKIADFGSAYMMNVNSLANGIFGTLHYVAPEVFCGSYDEKVDVWSCGIILYMMIFGVSPYSSRNYDDLAKEISSKSLIIKSSNFPRKSIFLIDFLDQLLRIDSKDRLSAKSALCHPWLQFSICADCKKPLYEYLLNLSSENSISTFLKAYSLIQIYLIADTEGISKNLNSKFLGTISNIIEKEIISIIGTEKSKQISLKLREELKTNTELLKNLYESFRNYVEIDEMFRHKSEIVENTRNLFINNENEQSIFQTVNSSVIRNEKIEFAFEDIDQINSSNFARFVKSLCPDLVL
ncbi:hypothetical protein SteCoe_11003 [Stentor coeruleus]|uniref:non-specific serine/threonine protein kinase n=1 Tax=Stentor coeruleus TaxID=5963 RepID=A0A1R2CE67_9CILI|nr:hypothetical protein SteCoe_11003 [Stentor coeruleus]